MKYIWVLVYLSLFFGSLILSSSSILNQVNALSCEGPITVERSFEDSKVVFLGEVISKKYYLQDEEYGYEDSIVKFKLKESFKGFSNETITLETSEWFWDPTYEEGNDYVVFAIINPQQNVLRPQSCTISSIPEEKNLQQLRLLANPEQTPKETLTLPPKKQIEKGIELEDVTCKEDLQLIFKYDGSPACVKPSTATKLVERGWGTNTPLPWTPTKGPSESPDTVSHGGDVVDYVSFVDNLRATGAIVTPGGSISQPFFTVEGIVILVNGDDVQVFEYPTFIDAEFDARKVSPDGSSIGTSMPFWIGSPHFYLKENIIVLYVGDNLDTLSIIESVLGSQFAGR